MKRNTRTSRHAPQKSEKKRNWIKSSIVAGLVVIPLTRWLAPDLIPFPEWSLWDTQGTTLTDWLWVGRYAFCWGAGINIAFAFWDMLGNHYHWRRKSPISDSEIVSFMGMGTIISIWAGVMEELAFRWLLFFGAFATLWLSNFLFFGFLGFGLIEWFHGAVWGPLADFTTGGHLHPYLFHESGWLVGGALLWSNAFFREGHLYQGLFGTINSWFLGMFFFYIMFNYGLGAAIVVHGLYDFAIFSTVAGLAAAGIKKK